MTHRPSAMNAKIVKAYLKAKAYFELPVLAQATWHSRFLHRHSRGIAVEGKVPATRQLAIGTDSARQVADCRGGVDGKVALGRGRTSGGMRDVQTSVGSRAIGRCSWTFAPFPSSTQCREPKGACDVAEEEEQERNAPARGSARIRDETHEIEAAARERGRERAWSSRGVCLCVPDVLTCTARWARHNPAR